MSFCDQEDADNRITLLLNFNRTQTLLPNQPKPTKVQSEITKGFVKKLPDELLVLFKQRYMEAKAFGEKFPKSYLVLEPGRHVNYMEVFPRNDEHLNFSYEDEKFFAEDSYELDPRIDNRTVQLLVYPLELDNKNQAPIFTYMYYFNEDQRSGEDSKLDGEKSDMLMALNQAFPNLNETLKKRYKEAKAVGDELVKASPKIPVFEQKIKPNDMCPCGSGKKYKKCCATKVN